MPDRDAALLQVVINTCTRHVILQCSVYIVGWFGRPTLPLRLPSSSLTPFSGLALPLLADFVISTISALLCMAYISRETPAPVEEGKPKPPAPVKATRSPVPCYFRWLQHVSWVLACLSSMVVMSVYWLVIVSAIIYAYQTPRYQ